MSSTDLKDKIISTYGGVNDGVSAQFTVNDTNFVFTDGVIYQSVDGCFSGGYKKAKTLKAVTKFINERV